MFSKAQISDGLAKWGQTAASSGRYAFNAILFAKMGRMWKKKPNQATAIALGTNVLFYAARHSPKLAMSLAVLQPVALRMIATTEIRDQKADIAAQTLKHKAGVFVKNNPISIALTAGLAAISGAQAVKTINRKLAPHIIDEKPQTTEGTPS